MKYSLLLLDLDGTILDYKTSEKKALIKLFETLKIEYKDEYLEQYSTINARYWQMLETGEIGKEYLLQHRFKEFFASLGITINEVVDENKIYLNNLSICTDLIDGALSLLEKIKDQFIIVAASNGIKYVQTSRLKCTNLTNYFDLVVISEEAGYEKPHRSFFDYCLATYPQTKKENILMIGDSFSSDIMGAINYGIDSCWYNPASKKAEMNPTYTIKSLDELIPILFD